MARRASTALVCCGAVTLGCVYPRFENVGDTTSSAGTTNSGGPAGEGGAMSSAGNAGKGGTTSRGGSSSGGTTTSGGATATGGIFANGGTTSGGGASSGGTTSIGGRGAGGSSGAAGKGGAAGTTNTGGTTSNGGTAGRASSGGTTSTGGTVSIAGAMSIGGTTTGGTTATGGAAGGSPGIPFVPASNSCQNLTTQCQGESCCTAITVPAGNFPMGRSEVTTASDYYPISASNELPEHDATVASFGLDKYKVTVGRFRKFVEAYDAWHVTGGNPLANTGAHPIATNTGWGQSWTAAASNLPADSTALKSVLNCNPGYQTWSDSAASNEAYAINCVNWYDAFAFCIWDGGRLPTEAEWEYAAAGGTQNRLYPWGLEVPDSTRANYTGSGNSPFIAVGSMGTTGAGYYGHQDLAGSVWEWVFDWYSATYYGTTASPSQCNNCANSMTSSVRVTRGGSWNGPASSLRAARRLNYVTPDDGGGFRCSRTP